MNDSLKISNNFFATPAIKYEGACLDAEKTQQKLDTAFNILFEEVLKSNPQITLTANDI